MFVYPVDQAVMFTFFGAEMTGKVLGQGPDPKVYIVLLDQRLPDAKALLVHEDDMKLLTCHWCRDTQQVPATPFYNDGNPTPTQPCPYCTEKAVVNG